MIISASRRTDILRYHSEWLLNELASGLLTSENPYNPLIRKQIPLAEVSQIVFWTRLGINAAEILDILDNKGIIPVFLFTITGYPDWLEPENPGNAALDSFIAISERVGTQRLSWRYDPVVFTENMDENFHLENFSRLCKALHRHTDTVIISLYDSGYSAGRKRMQQKKKRLGAFLESSPARLKALLSGLYRTAGQFGLSIQSCADSRISDIDFTLQEDGQKPVSASIPAAPCIRDLQIPAQHSLFAETEFAKQNTRQQKDPCQRACCLCTKSYDIGRYNSCSAGCLYCYATGYSN